MAAVTLARVNLGEDVQFSTSFAETRALVEKAGKLIPQSLFYMLNGQLPEERQKVVVERDGGRCVRLEEVFPVAGRDVILGVKGAGYTADGNKLSPKKPSFRRLLRDYMSLPRQKDDDSLDLFITSKPGSLCHGSMRPLGGQSRRLAEMSLDFSNKLSRKFAYRGAHFAPTVSVSGFDQASLATLDNLNYSNDLYRCTSYPDGTVTQKRIRRKKETFPLEQIVQEYRLLPAGISLQSFLIGEPMPGMKQKRFRHNFLSSLYRLAAFPINTLNKQKTDFYDLNPPFEGSLATESIVAKDGTVYWKDLDNIQIEHIVRMAFSRGKDTPTMVQEDAEKDSTTYIASALSYAMAFNDMSGLRFPDEIAKAKYALDDFVSEMSKARGAKFTDYKFSEKKTENEFWRLFQVKLSYRTATTPKGSIIFYLHCPVRPLNNALDGGRRAYFTEFKC